MNRTELIDCCGDYWNPMAGVFYKIAHRTVENKAEGAWVIDEDGTRFLDFACSYGVFIVGHGNAYVRQKVKEQLKKLARCPQGVMTEACAKYMNLLTSLLPGDLNKVVISNSGAESAEIAIRAAYLYNPGRKKIVVAKDSYHGKTLGALSFLGQKHHRKPFLPFNQQVVYVPYGDIGAIEKEIDEDTCAVVLEPVLGGPFITVPPAGYLKQVQKQCNKTDALFIVDEIQTGFGRAGKLFAIEYDAVMPDVMLLSKGITGGMITIATTVFRAKIEDKIKEKEKNYRHILKSDSGGSPLACAAATAAIEYILENNLVAKSKVNGAYLIKNLKDATSDFSPLVIDVPGTGLMTGIKVRNSAVESAIAIGMSKHKVHAGHSMNEYAKNPVLRFYPPLNIERKEIDMAVEALHNVLLKLNRMPGFLYDALNIIAKNQYRLPKSLLNRMGG